jgi:phospholipid/cholesterol/gamma-HCH transport system substrate-binding protein
VTLRTDTAARLLFVVVLLISACAGALWYWHSASSYLLYQIYTQDSVSGLAIDAPVEFHGVDVGKVKNIKLIGPKRVSILLSIDKTSPLSSASVATITSRGLATRGYTGYVYISLDDIGVDRRPLTAKAGEPYPLIPTAPSKIITLDTSIYQVTQNVQVISDLLQSVLDQKTIASFKESVDNLQQVSRALAANTGKLNSIVAHTERASHHLEPLLSSTSDMVQKLQTEIVPQLHGVLTDIQPLLESSHDTVSALQTEILPETHKALTNLESLSVTMTGLASKIGRDPAILIRGTTPPVPGPGESK